MSKKHKKQNSVQAGPSPVSQLGREEEYRIIKHDLLRVLTLNAVYLAGIILLYYSNLKNQFLEKWLEKVLHI